MEGQQTILRFNEEDASLRTGVSVINFGPARITFDKQKQGWRGHDTKLRPNQTIYSCQGGPFSFEADERTPCELFIYSDVPCSMDTHT